MNKKRNRSLKIYAMLAAGLLLIHPVTPTYAGGDSSFCEFKIDNNLDQNHYYNQLIGVGDESVKLYHWEGNNVFTGNDITVTSGLTYSTAINACGKKFSTISNVEVSADSKYVDIKTVTTEDATQAYKCDLTFKGATGTTFPVTFTWNSTPVLTTNQYYGNTYSHKLVLNVTIKEVLGDTDGDGEITLNDANITLKAALGIIKLESEETKLVDVNGDGDITLTDANMILKAALGITKL